MVTFRAKTQRGAGRGASELECPTINLDVSEIPPEISEGIYACRASLDDDTEHDAVLHYGPRPVFKDSLSFEVHVLDYTPSTQPEYVQVTLIGEKIRDVQDFPSPAALQDAIKEDIAAARAMLSAHAASS